MAFTLARINNYEAGKLFFDHFNIPYEIISRGENKGKLRVKPTRSSDGEAMQQARRAMELMKETGSATGPKQLGTFEASYLYPVLVRIGVISKLAGINQPEEGNEPISDLDNS